MAAMAAFTFSSCEDVPEPYTLPTQPAGPGNTDPNQKGSESNPYTVAEAIALIKAGTAPSTAVCVKGKITAVTFFNETYSSLSYNIADEGSSDVIEVYSGKGKDGANFSSKDDLKVGQTVVVKESSRHSRRMMALLSMKSTRTAPSSLSRTQELQLLILQQPVRVLSVTHTTWQKLSQLSRLAQRLTLRFT